MVSMGGRIGRGLLDTWKAEIMPNVNGFALGLASPPRRVGAGLGTPSTLGWAPLIAVAPVVAGWLGLKSEKEKTRQAAIYEAARKAERESKSTKTEIPWVWIAAAGGGLVALYLIVR